MERKLEKRFRILLKNNNTLMGKTVNYLIILFLYKFKEIRSDLQQQMILEGPCLVHTKGVHIRGHPFTPLVFFQLSKFFFTIMKAPKNCIFKELKKSFIKWKYYFAYLKVQKWKKEYDVLDKKILNLIYWIFIYF